MKGRERREQEQRARNAAVWPEQNRRIERLAQETLPLNDHFARGNGIWLEQLLQYVCALERRVAQLENRKEAP